MSIHDAALRILILSQYFEPEPGTDRCLPLARWLASHGHEVEVLTGVPNYPGGRVYPGYEMRWRQRQVMDGVPVTRVPLYPSHDRSPLRRFLNYGSFALTSATVGLASVRRPDVALVCHPPATLGLPAMIARAVQGVPFVYNIADMWPESVVQSGFIRHPRLGRLVERALTAWCNRVYAAASAITVISPGFKTLLVERGVPAEKVHVIYNWTDEDTFRPLAPDPALREQLGLSGKFVVLYAGNFGAYQGLGVVLDAAERLRDRPEVLFLLAGGGQEEGELRRAVSERRLDNVRFLERRPYREMPGVNALADVLLVHLRDLPFFAATIPSKTQVSLATGRPIIMAVRGDAAELIAQADAGPVIPPEDPVRLAEAVLALRSRSEAERAAMGARARAFYDRELALDVGSRRMAAVLRAAVDRRPARIAELGGDRRGELRGEMRAELPAQLSEEARSV
jgi:glycosyltransferase involved in cell wall biosynthesis